MGGVGFVAGALLAIVFGWSAVAKLSDRATVTRDFRAIGVPVPAAAVVIVAAIELVVASALILRPAVGAIAALGLLAVFSVVLASIIRSGREITCGCFGANSREPISVVELARNAALGVLGVLTLFADRSFAVDLPAVMVVSLTALCLLVGVNLIALARTSGALLRIELAGESHADHSHGGELP